jgi:hypothetical protein
MPYLLEGGVFQSLLAVYVTSLSSKSILKRVFGDFLLFLPTLDNTLTVLVPYYSTNSHFCRVMTHLDDESAGIDSSAFCS